MLIILLITFFSIDLTPFPYCCGVRCWQEQVLTIDLRNPAPSGNCLPSVLSPCGPWLLQRSKELSHPSYTLKLSATLFPGHRYYVHVGLNLNLFLYLSLFFFSFFYNLFILFITLVHYFLLFFGYSSLRVSDKTTTALLSKKKKSHRYEIVCIGLLMDIWI